MSLTKNNVNCEEFNNICRTCLINCDVKFTRNNVISKIFYKLTDIHFETNDDLPQQVCQKCFEKINEIQAFALQCIEKHFSLMNCLNNRKIEETKIELVEEQNKGDDLLIPLTSNVEVLFEEEYRCERPFKCELCPKLFAKSRHLKDHMRTHNNKLLYECDQCPQSFKHSDELNAHLEVHLSKFPFKCDQCSKSFALVSRLKGHQRTHTGERPYKCVQCAAAFAQSNSLQRHMRTHSGERPYVCTLCNQTFTNSSALNIHKRTHTGERPYQCPKCHRNFMRKDILTQHLLVHSEVRSCACAICGRRFKLKRNLKQHMKLHLREEPVKSETQNNAQS